MQAPWVGPGLGAPFGPLGAAGGCAGGSLLVQGAAPASSRLQLWPVSIGNISLKRSPTPCFPRNT